jgi:hypothetical protein
MLPALLAEGMNLDPLAAPIARCTVSCCFVERGIRVDTSQLGIVD